MLAGLKEAMVPRRGAWVGPLLIDLNLLVYGLMVFSGLGWLQFATADLLQWGANYGPALQGAGWLRLLTSLFLHGGLLHLLANLYSLHFSARLLEPLLRGWLLLHYLLAGLFASFVSVSFRPFGVSVGASGAVFGTFGMLLMLLWLGGGRLVGIRRALLGNLIVIILLNLAIGWGVPVIDNAAHVGGLLAGILLGGGAVLAMRRRR